MKKIEKKEILVTEKEYELIEDLSKILIERRMISEIGQTNALQSYLWRMLERKRKKDGQL